MSVVGAPGLQTVTIYTVGDRKDFWEWEDMQKQAGTEKHLVKDNGEGEDSTACFSLQDRAQGLPSRMVKSQPILALTTAKGTINGTPYDDKEAQNRHPERILGFRIQILSPS